MRSFIHEQPGIRVVFGAGVFNQLPEEVRKLGASRALILSSSRRRKDAEETAQRLGELSVGVFAGAEMHVPIEVARAACEAARKAGADCCIAIGGGSTIGLGKAVARETGAPIIAVPTTYSGSEMTPVYGFVEAGVKKTGRDLRVLPKTAIYDPVLTQDLPAKVAGPSGMNALAHCVAGLVDDEASPVSKLLAQEGAQSLMKALPRMVSNPRDLDARTEAFYGSWLAGSVLAAVRLNVHYKIAHALGGSFNLPHAEVHTVVLPQTVAYNLSIERAQEFFDLAVRIGAPVALKDIGMPRDGLDRAAKIASESLAYNPKPIDYEGIRKILENAYVGRRPL